MLICRGDGTLMIDPSSGDILWTYVCSPLNSWCQQNGYRNALSLCGMLNLDLIELPLPDCPDCLHYSDCLEYLDEDIEEPDNTFCFAIDEEMTATAILAALAELDEDESQDAE